jgi:hypothetical protein
MALSIDQITAVSFNDVRNEMRKPNNQWAESAFLRELEKGGFIKQVAGGPQAETTVDYRRNPGAAFLATDMSEMATSKTEVLTAAQYDWAELSVPMTWSRGDDAKNPTENQKVAFVKALIENGLTSHDDLIEQALFATSTQGFLGLQTQVPDDGANSTGGIDGDLEAWWRNYNTTYLSAGTNMEAKMTTVWNGVEKGSGSALKPTLLVTDGGQHALFEGTQQSLQRYVDTQDAKAGFKVLGFKTARFIYSQYSTTRVYFLNPKAYELRVVKGAFRDLGEKENFIAQNAHMRKIYTMLQTVVTNKSRLGVMAVSG